MLLVLIVATWKEMSGNALPLFRGCWVAPCKPISLAVTQPQRWKKNLKMGPELMTLDRGSYMSEIKTPGATPHCVWQTGHGSVLLHLGEKGGYYLHGNWHQGASSVTRETSSWGREQACNYALKLRGSRDWPSRACTESKRAAILNGLTIQAEIGWMPESRMTSSSQIAIFFFKPGVQVTFLNKERIRYKEPMLLNGGAVEDSWESLGLQGDQTSRS